jgi:hypothetical protein
MTAARVKARMRCDGTNSGLRVLQHEDRHRISCLKVLANDDFHLGHRGDCLPAALGCWLLYVVASQ